MGEKEHWKKVYNQKSSDALSWYRPHLEKSMAFVESCNLEVSARIVDIGGGASTLVDDLLRAGYENLAVVDLAEEALHIARERVGGLGESKVDWVVGDATEPLLGDASVDFWHDRAVFHFLNDPRQRSAYLGQVMRSLKPGGHVLVATFGLDGPESCSGLPITRYDAKGIHQVFGNSFAKVGEHTEEHRTPWGSTQSFVYCFCMRK